MPAFQGLNCFHLSRKYSDNDNRMQKRKELCSETTEDEAEDEDQSEDEEDAETQKADMTEGKEEEENEQKDERIGECAICHIVINDANFGGSIADPEQNPRCSKGYLLCQPCIRQFSIKSGAEHLQLRRSHANFSQCGDNDRANSRGTYDSSIGMYLRNPCRSAESRRDQRARHIDGAMTAVKTNEETIGYESNAVPYIALDRGDPRRAERTESRVGQRQQQHGCRDPTASRNDAADRYPIPEIKVKSLALVSSDCSRRPIHCPRLDCSVNVAFSALTHHFLFDHPEVPILSVEPGAVSTLIVSYGALSCNSSQCLALLLVSGKLSDSAARLFGGNQMNPRYRNRLPLPVLAARLHSNHNYACCGEVHAGGEGRCERDVIVAWVAGLDVGDTADRLRCSIQAVDSIENGGGFRSLTYTGPVTSLRIPQYPRDVFLAGDCIVLHEGLIGHITSGCTSLNVNVIVH